MHHQRVLLADVRTLAKPKAAQQRHKQSTGCTVMHTSNRLIENKVHTSDRCTLAKLEWRFCGHTLSTVVHGANAAFINAGALEKRRSLTSMCSCCPLWLQCLINGSRHSHNSCAQQQSTAGNSTAQPSWAVLCCRQFCCCSAAATVTARCCRVY